MPSAGALAAVRQRCGVENRKEREGIERLGRQGEARDLGSTLVEAEGAQWAVG